MKIVFFNKTRQKMGGGLLQFFNLANYICQTTNHTVYYINYYNIQINKMIDKTSIQFMDVEHMNTAELEGAVFITPPNYCFVLAELIYEMKDARILLYDWHPYALQYLANQFESQVDIKHLFELFAQKNALVFMDKSTQVSAQNFVETDFPDNYIPVVKEIDKNRFHILKRKYNDRISIGWLGRLDGDKMPSIINIADNIMNADLKEKVDFHIIGDGNKKHLLHTERYAGKIRFIFTSYLFDDEMYDYLSENVDVLFSMGTAALNGAEIGVPTVIVPMGNRTFHTNKFVYLFDTKDYTLGWNPKELKELGYTTYRFEDILRDSLNHKEEYGRKCFEHLKKYHVIEESIKNCLQFAEKTQLSIQDLVSAPESQIQLQTFFNFHRKTEQDYLSFLSYVQVIKRKRNSGRYTKLRNFCIKHLIDAPLGNMQKVYAKHLRYQKFMNAQKHYDEVLVKLRQRVRQGEKLKVAFFVVYDSVFPTLKIFQEMLTDELFEPEIVVVPDVERGIKNLVEVYQATLANLSQSYPDYVVGGYNIDADEYLEVNSKYDIVFFSNPYSKMAHPYHHVEYFLDKDVLTLYANYGFFTVKFGREIVKQDFYNLVWKVFIDSESNYQDLKKTEPIKGKNGVVVGYIKMDNLADVPIEKRNRKRILICPHHTVMGWKALDISNFLTYANFILELPQKYPEIDFIFRPHPMLFSNLVNKGIWTEEEIETYINQVNASPNMYYDHSGDYLTTFANSDAMIHDCASFTAEYLFTEKPCCYMLKDESQIEDVFLPMGQKCMEHYYKAFSEQDILSFIDNVVLNGNDPMKKRREEFARRELKFNFPNCTQSAISYFKSQLLK